MVDLGDSAQARRDLAEQGRTVGDLIDGGMTAQDAAREYARLLNNLRDTYRRRRVRAMVVAIVVDERQLAAVPDPEPEPESKPRHLCGHGDCQEARAPRSPWCDVHTHDWIGLAEVPMDPRFVAGAARKNYTELAESTYVRVLEVVCSSCRRGFAAARSDACEPFDDVLKGGPIGTRQRHDDDDGEGASGDTHPMDAVASGS